MSFLGVVFAPLIAMTWAAILLDGWRRPVAGRVVEDEVTYKPAVDRSELSLSPEAQAWLAEMESLERF